MEWLTSMFSGGAAKVAEKVSEGLDSLFTSDEEKGILANKRADIARLVAQEAHTFELSLEQQVTDRHKADMQSDSWLSKNIRPMTLIFCLFGMLLIGIADYVGKPLEGGYISMINQLTTIVFGFYFVIRGAEKGMKMFVGKGK